MGAFEVYARATPWFMPSILLVGAGYALLLVSRRPDHAVLRWCTALSVTGFVAATATPSGSWSPWDAGRSVSWQLDLPRVTSMSTWSEPWVNVAIAAPMGLCCVLWFRRRPRTVGATLFILPVAVEVVQCAAPPLGRSGFLVADVVNTWLGAGLGGLVGLTILPILGPRSDSALDSRSRLGAAPSPTRD